jgi:hypothetical protein
MGGGGHEPPSHGLVTLGVVEYKDLPPAIDGRELRSDRAGPVWLETDLWTFAGIGRFSYHSLNLLGVPPSVECVEVQFGILIGQDNLENHAAKDKSRRSLGGRNDALANTQGRIVRLCRKYILGPFKDRLLATHDSPTPLQILLGFEGLECQVQALAGQSCQEQRSNRDHDDRQ